MIEKAKVVSGEDVSSYYLQATTRGGAVATVEMQVALADEDDGGASCGDDCHIEAWLTEGNSGIFINWK